MTAAVLALPRLLAMEGGCRAEAVGVAPVAPRVLTRAAELLPVIATGGVVLYADLHEVMVAGLVVLGLGRDRHHRLELADIVRDRLAGYLVATGAAPFGPRTSTVLRGWVIGQELSSVQAALVAAAGFWRREQRQPRARCGPPPAGGEWAGDRAAG